MPVPVPVPVQCERECKVPAALLAQVVRRLVVKPHHWTLVTVHPPYHACYCVLLVGSIRFPRNMCPIDHEQGGTHTTEGL